MSARVAKLVTMPTWSFDSVCQSRLHFLCLSKRDLLSIGLRHSINDLLYIGIQGNVHELRYCFQQELQLARLRSFDILMRFPEVRVCPEWLARMVVIACGDLRISPFHTVIRSYAEGAVWT